MIQEKIPATIVITTYNRVMKLFRLLKSLDRMNTIPDEIIIIEDNSNDGTQRLLEKWKSLNRRYQKSILVKKSNRGPADSRNLGLINSMNELIIFTDDDVIVDRDWIKYITLRLHDSDNKLVGFGGAVKSLNQDVLSKYNEYHKILEAPRHLNYLPTVNCCFKKTPLMKNGGFDTNFCFAGGEDTDLCLRLRNKGYYFLKEKRAIVYHEFSRNFLDFCKRWIRYGKGTQLALLKSRGIKND